MNDGEFVSFITEIINTTKILQISKRADKFISKNFILLDKYVF